jgi:hypothetical protein
MRVVVFLLLTSCTCLAVCAEDSKKEPVRKDAFTRCTKILKYGALNEYVEPSKDDAVVAMGLLGDERAIPLLVEQLANTDNDNLRFKIVKSLAWLKSAKAVTALEGALKDPNVHVRNGAAYALKAITGKTYREQEVPPPPPGFEHMIPPIIPAGSFLEIGKTYRFVFTGGTVVGKVLETRPDKWIKLEATKKSSTSWVNLDRITVVTPDSN